MRQLNVFSQGMVIGIVASGLLGFVLAFSFPLRRAGNKDLKGYIELPNEKKEK